MMATRRRALAAAAFAAAAVVVSLLGVARVCLDEPAAVVAAPEGIDHGLPPSELRDGPAEPAQLRDAYVLADTWDGSEGQGAPGSVLYPAGIDIVGDDVLLVDRGNSRVQRFEYGGRFVAAWGHPGEALGELSDPRDVAIDGQSFYVTDSGNKRVVAYSMAGVAEAEWTVPGLDEPWGIAARSGRVYVTDRSDGEVVALEAGVEAARWSGLDEPRGVDVGADGRVYVADYGASEVRFYSADGTPSGSLATNLPPIDVEVDRLGDLYVQSDGAVLWYPAGSAASRQALYSAGMQGLALTEQRGIYASVARVVSQDAVPFHGVLHYPWQPGNVQPDEWPLLGYPPGRLNRPHAIHAGPSGRIWVLDGWPRLQAFDASGSPEAQIVLRTGVPPVEMVESPDGEMIVGETRRLLRVQPTGAISQFVRLSEGATDYWLTSLAWREGLPRVSVLDSALMAARDYGVTQTMQPIGGWPLEPGTGWTLYWDIAVPVPNPANRAYVVSRSSSEVLVYENGTLANRWHIEGVPTKVDVGPDGSAYVLTVDGLVRKLTPDGNVVAAWDVSAYSAGASEVVDLAVDATGRVYTVDRLADTVRVWELDPDAVPEPPASRGGLCRLRGDKRAEPEAIRIGDTAKVTLQIGGECPNTSPRADILLAIDRSGSMNDSNKITATREAALVFLGQIDMARDRAGVVTFNNSGRLAQPLTHDRAAAESAVRGITAVGGTNIAEAISVSIAELFGANSRPDTQPVIILLTDGRDREPDDALAEAALAQARGTRLFTIGFGDVDPMVMVLSASTPEDYYYTPDTNALVDIYTEIARRITAEYLATSMTVVDELPDNMLYVSGSAVPPARWDPTAHTLTWTLTDVPFEGLELSFDVEPTQLGVHPTNVQASATYVDGLDEDGELRFPVPAISVLSLEPTATATSTQFPTPTPRPTNTPLPPEPIFLPLALKQQCRPESYFADVALVMDTSSSMSWPSQEGSEFSKLDLAVDAAHTFIDLLTLPGDQATIVSFNRDAAVEQTLTGDLGMLRLALDALEPKEGTRIDRGIIAATEELTSERAVDDNNKVMIILTDGRSSSVEDSVVREVADSAKGQHITIYTIGLGEDLDEELLSEIATWPEYAFLAPTAEELEQIYLDIAFTLDCPNLTWP